MVTESTPTGSSPVERVVSTRQRFSEVAMSEVTVRCKFCGQLFLMARPLFKGERDQATCPKCTAQARANTEQMRRDARSIYSRHHDAEAASLAPIGTRLRTSANAGANRLMPEGGTDGN